MLGNAFLPFQTHSWPSPQNDFDSLNWKFHIGGPANPVASISHLHSSPANLNEFNAGEIGSEVVCRPLAFTYLDNLWLYLFLLWLLSALCKRYHQTLLRSTFDTRHVFVVDFLPSRWCWLLLFICDTPAAAYASTHTPHKTPSAQCLVSGVRALRAIHTAVGDISFHFHSIFSRSLTFHWETLPTQFIRVNLVNWIAKGHFR